MVQGRRMGEKGSGVDRKCREFEKKGEDVCAEMEGGCRERVGED